MARQVLENGVILPAEYSDDWYDDMTSNLTKLDDVIGSDSEKLSSADVGAAALSNNYNDLDNLPTIPSVNDATLTIQKNGTTVQTFTANASSNVTANITVPTKTSDLTNDSNFVDTSNSAVSSGITSAKVTSYDSHIADTDIHVTTADKNKWNNQTFVFRYSSTALTASSTNSNTLLDNTDNLKVGDKVIDSSGVLFSITAIDTQNSTFTIGTALIDLAQDSDVVHKSGDETVAGSKTFSYNMTLYNSSASVNPVALFFKNKKVVIGSTTDIGSQNIAFRDSANTNLSILKTSCESVGNTSFEISVYNKDSNNQTVSGGMLVSQTYANTYITPTTDNAVLFGSTLRRWSKIYGTEYYYGSNNVEFSTKFVTTDTNQTISESKTFANTIKIKKEIELNGSRLAYILPSFSAGYSGLNLCTYDANGAVKIGIWKVDDNDNTKHVLNDSLGYLNVSTGMSNSVNIVYLIPRNASKAKLGDSINKWHEINGLNPSSLSLPDFNNRIDISSYITDLSGAGNTYTPTVNGWICVRSGNATKISILDSATSIGNTTISNTATYLTVMIPVVANRKVLIIIMCTSLEFAYFIPCQGNV